MVSDESRSCELVENPDVPSDRRAAKLLAAWREQDEALQEIHGATGFDALVTCPADVTEAVVKALAGDAGARPEAAPFPAPPTPVVNLMEALKQSLNIALAIKPPTPAATKAGTDADPNPYDLNERPGRRR